VITRPERQMTGGRKSAQTLKFDELFNTHGVIILSDICRLSLPAAAPLSACRRSVQTVKRNWQPTTVTQNNDSRVFREI